MSSGFQYPIFNTGIDIKMTKKESKHKVPVRHLFRFCQFLEYIDHSSTNKIVIKIPTKPRESLLVIVPWVICVTLLAL
jgi:hypothetical protein